MKSLKLVFISTFLFLILFNFASLPCKVQAETWGVEVGDEFTFHYEDATHDRRDSYKVTSVDDSAVKGKRAAIHPDGDINRYDDVDLEAEHVLYSKAYITGTLSGMSSTYKTYTYGGRDCYCLCVRWADDTWEAIDTDTGIIVEINGPRDGSDYEYENTLVSWDYEGDTNDAFGFLLVDTVIGLAFISLIYLRYSKPQKMR
jgi:hypothetical protein